MKKLYAFSLALLSAASFGQSIVITKVVDGTLPMDACNGTGSSNPKFVEMYVSGTMDFNLPPGQPSYRIQTESNGAANEAGIYWNDGLFLYPFGTVTDAFVYVVNLPQAQEGQTQVEEIGVFLEMYPQIPSEHIIFSTYAPNMNGNDALRIAEYNGDTLTEVVDQFGNPLEISAGNDYSAAWAYADSYASRIDGVMANGGNFASNTFYYGGNDALDNATCDSFQTAVNIASYSILATDKFETVADLKMYPNPLSGNVLNIVSDSNAAMTVAIYDVLGKQVVNTKVTNGTVNASALSAGVYIVKIIQEGKTATKKLVVK